ncbi:MAG TPA: hypothetical protein VFC67_20905 [Prolixibacteraceae bacterium]|nr:hypothetical protein [Prolixibacteraceae bacterium]
MKTILSILIVVLFFSCASKKAVQQSKIEQKTTQQNSIADTKASQVNVNKTVVDESKNNDETVTKTTVYDTDKPNVGDTGKPPVKSETVTTTTKAEKKNVKTVIDSAKKDESAHIDNSKLDNQGKEQTKSAVTTKPTVKYYFYIIGLLVLIALGYLGYRNFGRIKALFN